MRNAREIIEFYKGDKISKRSFEAEIARLYSSFLCLSVELDNETILGQTNASYIAMLVPENINGTVKTTLVLDSNAIKNKLSVEDVDYVLDCAERLIPSTIRHFVNFRNANKDSEVGYIDCIALYLNFYKVLYEELIKLPSIENLVREKTIDIQKIADVQLAIENGTEKSSAIVEYISVHKLLPSFALHKAEALFQELNRPVNGTEADDKPIANQWYAKAASLSTGIINPEYHQDLDPYYIPKR